MEYNSKAIEMHKHWKGKIEISTTIPIENEEDLALAYTPGVAGPCLMIRQNVDLSYTYTRRWNLVAVVTDGSAVLGLGDIGPEAAMPVMEGKCALFKKFGNVDAFPLCVNSKNIDEIVNTISLLTGGFGGINLEDISAPRCFEIEKKLKGKCDIPVFHDDQHGTAISVLAGIINALKVVNKDISQVSIVVSGAGAAGIATTKLLVDAGAKNIVLCDRDGAIYQGRSNLTFYKKEISNISNISNTEKKKGSLEEVMLGADIFIGLSAPNIVTEQMISSMASDAIVLAMANPVPEILPQHAKAGGAKVIGTGRSDFPNQINNVLAFPGIFRGALDCRARDINKPMKIAAARAIASMVKPDELCADYIVPFGWNKQVAQVVATAIIQAAKESGVSRK